MKTYYFNVACHNWYLVFKFLFHFIYIIFIILYILMQGRVFKFLCSIYIYIYFILFILLRIWSYAHVKCVFQIINITIIIIRGCNVMGHTKHARK